MANRTKRDLGEALKQLLGTKPLEKITISEITELAGVNRMTFYYHFQDIYDLVEWLMGEEAERAIAGKLTYDNWQEGLLAVFGEIRKNKTYIRNLNHSMTREHLESYLHRLTDSLLLEVLGERMQDEALAEDDARFIIEFYRYAFLGVLIEWIEKGMKENHRAIVQKMELMTRGVVTEIVQRFAEER